MLIKNKALNWCFRGLQTMAIKNIGKLPLNVRLKVADLLGYSVSTFIFQHTVKVPKSMKTDIIQLNTDQLGFIEDDELLDNTLIGTAFDYLTRIVVCHNINAFDFLLPWYKRKHLSDIDGLEKLEYLNRKIKKKLRNVNINRLTVAKLRLIVEMSSFEQYLRSDKWFRKEPNLFLVDNSTLQHFKIMLFRSKNFFDNYGYPYLMDFHCQIGDVKVINDLINNPRKILDEDINHLSAVIFGDGDYLLNDAIVDFKVYKDNKTVANWQKQLLLYYFGLIDDELKGSSIKKAQIHYLINFNPRYDKVYKYSLDVISDQDKKDFINNIMLSLEQDTNKARDLTYKTYKDMQTRDITTEETANNFKNPFLKYEDGIHQILREDYIKFYRSKNYFDMRCRWVGQYYLVKHNGYYMFFLKRNNNFCLFDGGHLYSVEHDLTYYYDNLLTYASKIKKGFSPYWKALQQISKEIKLFGGTGKIHGSIVDIDFTNHIYLAPQTGKMEPYFAGDMLSRIHYSSVKQLLSDNKTNETTESFQNIYRKRLDHKDMLRLYNKHISELTFLNHDYMISDDSPQKYKNCVIGNDVFEDFYDKDMYYRSRLLNKVEYLYKINTIRFWRDAVVQSKDSAKLISRDKGYAQHRLSNLSFAKQTKSQKLQTRFKYFDFAKGFRIPAKKYKAKKIVNSSLLPTHFSLNNTELMIMIYSAIDFLIKQLSDNSDWQTFLLNYEFDHLNLAIADKDIDDKLITPSMLNQFNKLLKVIFSLTKIYGKPICVKKIVNNKASIDIEFAKIYVNLDLLKSSKILKTMNQNLKSIRNDVHGKKLGIFNLATGILYVKK